MIKNTTKLCRRFFLHKINKNKQQKPEVKCFAEVDVTYVDFNTLLLHNFVKTDQNAKAVMFWSQVPFNVVKKGRYYA